jgi:DNA segregation ATPase FtsK/SpoIIIE-like protein
MHIQSAQIEKLLSRHRIAGRVTGRQVRRQARHHSATFDLHLDTGLERLRALKEDLVAVLGVPEVYISHHNGRWRLEVCQGNGHPVDLLDLLAAVPDVPPVTALMGFADADAGHAHETQTETAEGQPVMLDFLAPDVSHILVAGDGGAGKTVLLRTIALSLALNSRQSEVQLILVEPTAVVPHNPGRLLRPLAYLPHVLAPVVRTLDEMMDVADFLVKEIAYRRQQQVKTPAIVLLIDETIALLAAGGRPFAGALTTLLQQGAAVGIHLVLSANDAASPHLTRLMKAHLPIRLVGRTADAAASFAATGSGAVQAEYLVGRGDFLAVTYTTTIRFQAAHITDSDLHLVLNCLHRQRAPVLTAQPCQEDVL